ncbi:hypothetical protein [Nocardia niwae]|uniref:Uncharacterized protein n=1 Tax=Nocardia niwae TaxID=626084 RepID=A0ABV2X6Z2_9NOCA
MLHAIAPRPELEWLTTDKVAVHAALAYISSAYAADNVIAVWMVDTTGIRHRADGTAAEVGVRTRGWDPRVGPLEYELLNQS